MIAIRALDGTVVADDTLFVNERYGQGWAQDDLQWDYGAPVSALTVNDNIRYLTIAPGASAAVTTPGPQATSSRWPRAASPSAAWKREATWSSVFSAYFSKVCACRPNSSATRLR